MAEARPLAARLHDALPQTQCRRCGYDDCRTYAEAIADSRAELNRCPPGGAEGIDRLAAIAGRPPVPLDPECGVEAPRGVAVVDEAACIGCALCLEACPVDAIVGAARQMHTVIEPACTGCELCIPVCPVDCIAMHPASGAATGWSAWSRAQADDSRRRYEARLRREAASSARAPAHPLAASPASKREAVAAAVARARAARAGA